MRALTDYLLLWDEGLSNVLLEFMVAQVLVDIFELDVIDVLCLGSNEDANYAQHVKLSLLRDLPGWYWGGLVRLLGQKDKATKAVQRWNAGAQLCGT